MLLIGIALIIVVFFLKENNNDDISFAINDTVVWLSVCVGSLIIIVSFLGCVGVCFFIIMLLSIFNILALILYIQATTQSKCLLSIFIILLSLCLILEITGIVLIFADQSLIKDNIKKEWDRLTPEQQEKYENDNKCSGYDDCYSKIEDGIKDHMYIVGGITIGVFVYQLVMTIFAFCLCCGLGRKTSKPRRATMEEV